jgi:hypothetical protein
MPSGCSAGGGVEMLTPDAANGHNRTSLSTMLASRTTSATQFGLFGKAMYLVDPPAPILDYYLDYYIAFLVTQRFSCSVSPIRGRYRLQPS